ncbi:G-type lectin S-receptor-like serine/threonine-protein kinase At1g61490 isoform X1 [Cannabis sativa]|uniref:G-type lectin S-receptor-like serine/threonine-protein kinase At1g61490 isoform X1 n=1 Tax=Cannabis sativa TaxID=3483 RepID=UPI0029C9B3E5|nr:G-type lectin S-receptor-like serine/threonine-protein kinase At1g61490 isoform X1 [Cannabis sativa]
MAAPSSSSSSSTLTLLFVTLLCCSSTYAVSNNLTSSSQPLSPKQTLVSSNQVFELGFFNPTNSSNLYLGIWYKGDSSPHSVVWVANRENPLSSLTSPLVQISSINGNLELLSNQNSSVIWSTELDISSNTTQAILLNNGNLVLKDSISGSELWQSFHNPGDTFLPSSVLGFNLKTGDNYKLISWKSETDPSPGNFSFGIAKKKPPEAVVWIGSEIYARSGPWDKLKFTGVPEMGSSYKSPYNLVEEVEEGTTYLYFNNGYNDSVVSKVLLSPDGMVTIMLKDRVGGYWYASYQGQNECDQYGICGPFGVCKITESPICKCLKGFKPKSMEEWSEGNWSGGCVRESELNLCHNKSDGDVFGVIGEVCVPDFYEYIENGGNTIDSCHALCLKNCSCIAYSFINGIGCLVWSDSNTLLDITQFESNTTGDDLFFRLSGSESQLPLQKPGHNHNKIKIMVGVVVAVSGVVFSVVVVLCLQRRKNSNERKAAAMNNDLIWTSSKLKRGGGDDNDQPELHFFDLDSVAMATNRFSIANKLGQGGFGPVYKGELHGKEVAVKRLSSSSSQGDEEFRNEMILISKLQHRNLVKLIGCCIENEEKLLIYEFMLNKSLDTFIFDDKRRRSAELDWSTRFKIIEGIARGLVYLHRDSSLRVIHRDLKASNILLDEKMNPKISDFGLARIFEGTLDLANTHRVVGTIGYMSPEYALRGIFSEKSDVFSYGVLILEIISGKKNTSFKGEEEQYQGLIAYAWQLWSESRGIELVDESLGESCINESSETMMRCIHIGLLCVQDFASDRPSMAQVASMLTNHIFDQPQPKQPIFTFQPSTATITTHNSETATSSSNNTRCSATMTMVEPR